jgi:hypothetical protein
MDESDSDRARSGIDAHERASSRFSDLVRSLPPEPRPVRSSEWSTVEVAAHVLSVFRGDTRAAAGIAPLWPSLDGVAGNQRLLDETPERDPDQLADAIDVAGGRGRGWKNITALEVGRLVNPTANGRRVRQRSRRGGGEG